MVTMVIAYLDYAHIRTYSYIITALYAIVMATIVIYLPDSETPDCVKLTVTVDGLSNVPITEKDTVMLTSSSVSVMTSIGLNVIVAPA